MKFKRNDGDITRDIEAEKIENERYKEFDLLVIRYNRKDDDHSGLNEILEQWCALKPQQADIGWEGKENEKAKILSFN